MIFAAGSDYFKTFVITLNNIFLSKKTMLFAAYRFVSLRFIFSVNDKSTDLSMIKKLSCYSYQFRSEFLRLVFKIAHLVKD